jgi:hypothetical protein
MVIILMFPHLPVALIRYSHAMTCLLALLNNKWKKAITIVLQTKTVPHTYLTYLTLKYISAHSIR